MTSEFVHRKRYEEMMDVTHATVTNWMQKKWQRGKHYVVVGKNTFINLSIINFPLDSVFLLILLYVHNYFLPLD